MAHYQQAGMAKFT